MTQAQYRKALKTLNLTIVGAAPVLGISRRQAQRIAAGSVTVPVAIAKLLTLALKHGEKVEDL